MIPYRLVRSSRKTVAIQITPGGEVILRCPNRYPRKAAEAFLESKRDWIKKHLEKIAQRPTGQRLTPEEVRALARQAGEDLPRRAARFAPLVGVTYGRITIRSQRTRWGSCSAKGNLNFNCLLMLAPEDVRDYVVVHELCHRKEMNHSKAFYSEVLRVFPDYWKWDKWLKENGDKLMRRMMG